MTSTNEMLGNLESYQRMYGRACKRCYRVRPPAELNYEALVHHNARILECIDRKRCGRQMRGKRR